jgi:hypothetical protein
MKGAGSCLSDASVVNNIPNPAFLNKRAWVCYFLPSSYILNQAFAGMSPTLVIPMG